MTRSEAVAYLRAASFQYYTYVLADSSGRPFYVGKGTGARVFQHESDARNTVQRTHKLNVIRKLHRAGKEVCYAIAGVFDSEQDSLALERELIQEIGRHDLGTGPLTNQTDGGEGPTNPSEESRLRRLATLGGEAADPERRVANEFFGEIAGKQRSVPIKPLSSWKRVEPLRPSTKNKHPSERLAKAVVASALANNLQLKPGVEVPRLLTLEGVQYLIENGCGRAMISTGLVEAPSGQAAPKDETMKLTVKGMRYVQDVFGDSRLVELGVVDP